MTKEINTNLALWESLQATDPKYTKEFKGAGGFSGTAINGAYILKRLTEAFGPCGKGWKFVLDDERVVEGHKLKSGDTAKLHIVRGHLDYLSSGAWHETSPQFGQTMLVGENKNGTYTDEEAPKKSITDAISKCAVLIGIGADVHLGLFDDSKYVNDRKREVAAEVATGVPVLDTTKPMTVHNNTGRPQEVNGQTLLAGAKLEIPGPDQTDDKTIARQVFYLVKGVAEKATTAADIDDCLKHNAASLRVLERYSTANYETLKGVVKTERERLNKVEMNQDLPEFEDIGR